MRERAEERSGGARLVGAVALALVVVAAPACSRCGKETAAAGKGAPILRRLPRGTGAVALAPDTLALGQALRVVQDLKVVAFAAQFRGFGSAGELADALVGQVGVDIRSAEALDKAGVDPKKGLAVVFDQTGQGWVVLGVKSEGRLHATLQTLATDKLGAGIHDTEARAGVTLHRFSRVAGVPPRLGYVAKDGFFLVATDAQIPSLVDWANLSESESLATDTAFAEAQQRLPKERELVVWVPKGSLALLGGPLEQVAWAVHLDAKGLVATVDAPAGRAAPLLAALEPKQGADLLPLLGADPFLVGRFSGDPKVFAPVAQRLFPPQVARAFGEVGFDVEAEVLNNLAPGATFGLSLSPRAALGSGLPQSFDPRRTNPFAWVELVGAAQALDAAKLPATLDKLAQAGPRFGADIQKTEREGRPPVWVTRWSAGEGVHFGAKGTLAAFGSPLARVDGVLDADGKGPGPVQDPELGKVLDGHGLAVVVDLRKLADQVRALPSEAWGLGGFAIKASTVRWLDATDDLKTVSLSLRRDGDFLQGQAVLRLGPAQAQAAP